jgi:outer membrane protein
VTRRAARAAGARAGVAVAALFLATGCFPYTSGFRGLPETSPAAHAPWTPPPRAAAPAPVRNAAPVPDDLADRLGRLGLKDVVDIALRNNTATQAAWARARAAAAAYDVKRNAYLPTASASATATRLQTVATQGRAAVRQTVYSPAANLTFLLFDFGGRSGEAADARETLFAADWTHNATIQSVVLQAEQGYFRYMAQKALLRAQKSSLEEAKTNLTAAEERHRVGLATIADVLQARTARSQVQLVYETTQGDLLTTRGALATAMGLPADVPYDIEAVPDSIPALGVADSVSTLIDRALNSRPDLAAAWSSARAARARVGVERAKGLPEINVAGTASKSYLGAGTRGGEGYSGSVSLEVPLLPFLTHHDDVRQAKAEADAAEAEAKSMGQQVVYQVFSSYHSLATATQRVRTSRDLLESAQAAEEVALGRYRAGAGSALDLLSAQSALADARAQEIDARFGWYSALAQLAHDVGVLGVDGEAPFRLVPDTTGTRP